MLIKMALLLIGEKIVLKSLLIEKAKVTRSKSFFLVLHNPVCLNILPSVYIMKEKRTVILMREKKNHLYVDSEERKLLLHRLVGLKNQLIQQGRYTDCVDELIIKVIHAPVKKLRVEMAGRSDV